MPRRHRADPPGRLPSGPTRCLLGVVAEHRLLRHPRIRSRQLDSRRQRFQQSGCFARVDAGFGGTSHTALKSRADPQDIPCPEELARVAVDRERLVERSERLFAHVRQVALGGEPLQQLHALPGVDSRREPQRALVLVQSFAVRTDRRGVLGRDRRVPEHGAGSRAASA